MSEMENTPIVNTELGARQGETKSVPEYTEAKAREMWTREDQLINQRIQWLCITQGLLFAAYSLSFQLPEAVLKTNASFRDFITVLPAAGVWVSLLSLGILSAVIAMMFVYARSPWTRPGVTWLTTIGGIVCAIGIPFMFALVWLKVLESSAVKFMRDTVSVVTELLR